MKELKRIINKIRRLAVKNHIPMKEDFLNSVTKNIGSLDIKELEKHSSKASIFRKVRLLYSLNYRNQGHESITYKIRNGKAFSDELHTTKLFCAKVPAAIKSIRKAIVNDLKKNVNGKKIYIPKFIDYSLPATEKQFTGNFPSGTKVKVDENMIVGIHWENQKGKRSIDLDLSLNSIAGDKFGWDGMYRDEDRNILFSGDLTDASLPKGASELFYVKNLKEGVYLLAINYYNYEKEIPVPFKIVVGADKAKGNFGNYVLDPNKILAVSNSIIDIKQKIIGSLTVSKNGCEFVFAETNMGKGISFNTSNEYVKHAQQYLYDFYKDSIGMRELLEDSGAEIIEDKTSLKDEEFIDLSVEVINKDTILLLMK